MSQHQNGAGDLPPEERHRLDKKADLALVICILIFGIAVTGLILAYRGKNSGYRNAPPGPPGPHRHGRGNDAAPLVDQKGALNQRALDEKLARGEFGLVRQELEKMLTVNPDNFLAQLQMGLLYYRMGEWKKSREFLEKARAINPHDQFCLETLGKIYTRTDPEIAVELYEKNLSYRAEMPEILLELALAYINAAARIPDGDEKRASYLEKAMKLTAQAENTGDKRISPDRFNLLRAEYNYLKGNYREADLLYGKVLSSDEGSADPSDPVQAYTARGAIALRNGKKKEALEYFKKARDRISRWKEIIADRLIPREEQLALIIYTLQGKNVLGSDLEEIKKSQEDLLRLGLTYPGDNKHLGELIRQMVKSAEAGETEEAAADRDEILETLSMREGDFIDAAILNPLFRETLGRYMKTGK